MKRITVVVLLFLLAGLTACQDMPTSGLAEEEPLSFTPSDGAKSVQEGASVSTDKDDYAPGETVTITGSGWLPGETVKLVLNEAPEVCDPRTLIVVADENGNFVNTEFKPEEHHVGVQFTLVATGQTSGRTAQVVFTDGNPQSPTVSSAQSPNPVAPGGSATYGINVPFAGNSGSCTATLSATAGTPAGWAGAGTFSFSPNQVTGAGGSNQLSTLTVVAPGANGTYTFRVNLTWNAAAPGCQGSGSAMSALINLVVGSSPPSNQPPTVAADNASVTVNEGSTATNTGTFNDPNGNNTVTLSASVGTVIKNDAAGTWSWSFGTNDGPAQSQTVTISADDGSGGMASTTFGLTVNNVAPTATFGDNGPVDEGSNFMLSLTSPSDPSSVDVAAGFTYAFDCGGGSGLGAFGSSNTASCPTTDNGVRSVKGVIRDKDLATTEYTASVTVNNVAPTATFGDNGPVDEGSNFMLSLTNPSDPSSVDVAAGFTYAFDCGGGSGLGAFGSSNTASCPTTDNGVRSVKGQIKDKDGGFTEYTASVTVNNVAPSVSISSPAPGALFQISQMVTVNAPFTDPGTADTHTCSVNWGDGSAATVVNPSVSPCTASRSYVGAGAGVYTIVVTVTDDDGGVGQASVMVVVYDPSAGFVTGGGWINSPAGAYKPNMSLTGKANFGFVSKYKKGATVPTGNTEFQFQAGGLNFHSASYEWLVVNQNGTNAQFRGTGTINGSGSYKFMLWATDGSPDTFRIKIWEENGGEVVIYDNGVSQALGGGSIVIHAK